MNKRDLIIKLAYFNTCKVSKDEAFFSQSSGDSNTTLRFYFLSVLIAETQNFYPKNALWHIQNIKLANKTIHQTDLHETT